MSTNAAVNASQQWLAQLDSAALRVQASEPLVYSGRIIRATGLVLEATGLRLPVGPLAALKSLPHKTAGRMPKSLVLKGASST